MGLAVFHLAQAFAISGRKTHYIRKDLFWNGGGSAHGPCCDRQRGPTKRRGEDTSGVCVAFSTWCNNTEYWTATVRTNHSLRLRFTIPIQIMKNYYHVCVCWCSI